MECLKQTKQNKTKKFQFVSLPSNQHESHVMLLGFIFCVSVFLFLLLFSDH